MKHYVLPYFPQTLLDDVRKHTIKYGDNEENLKKGMGWDWNDPVKAKDKDALALVGNPKGRVPLNQSLNKYNEVNGNVILDKQGTNPLGLVAPWDMLMILGHGVTYDEGQAHAIGSDPMSKIGKTAKSLEGEVKTGEFRWLENKQLSGRGTFTASANSVADWLNGKLRKPHVLLKLVMCFGGGPFKERIPDDNFAKQMARMLFAHGYTSIAVGGYRGATSGGTNVGSQLPTKELVGPSGRVVAEGVPAKQQLDYYHGEDAHYISSQAIKIVKSYFRDFAMKTPIDFDEFITPKINLLKTKSSDDAKFILKAATMLQEVNERKKELSAQQTQVPSIQPVANKPVNQPQIQTPPQVQTPVQYTKYCPDCMVGYNKWGSCTNIRNGKVCGGKILKYTG